jgi:hypothetical protein
MFDWIIEADVYRLRKAAREATSPRERSEMEALAEQKLNLLERTYGSETSSHA